MSMAFVFGKKSDEEIIRKSDLPASLKEEILNITVAPKPKFVDEPPRNESKHMSVEKFPMRNYVDSNGRVFTHIDAE